nr:MAG TPA: hypothetical protein [Caudoviricetes sp.]
MIRATAKSDSSIIKPASINQFQPVPPLYPTPDGVGFHLIK